MKSNRRALALVSVLLFAVLLLVLTLTLVRGASAHSQGATAHSQRLAAGYLAEAGLAEAIEQLQANPSWRVGFPHERSYWQSGSYHLHFSSGPGFASTDSVNNLDSDVAVAGPHGPATVPARSAYLVITGQVGMVTRTIEATLGPRTLSSFGGPLLADGPIGLGGATQVDGIETYGGEVTQVTVHSNFGGTPGLPTIRWDPLNSADRLRVTGNLTAVDPRPPAQVFQLNGSYSVDDQLSDQSKITPPDVNVAGEVAAHSGAPSPGLTGLNTVLGPGDHYLSTDTDYAGNIVLQDGANLYVGGDLEITGSITGKGAVFSSGNVTLSGSADVSSKNRVGLAAEGDVTLQGFDGNKYLRDLPGGPHILNDIKRVTEKMDYYLQHPDEAVDPMPAPTAGTLPTWASNRVLGNMGALDRLNGSLGGESANDLRFFHDVAPDRVGALVELVNAQPPTSQKTFVLNQLTKLKTLTRWTVTSNGPESKADGRDKFMAAPGLDHPIALDCMFDTLEELDSSEQERGLRMVRDLLSNFSVDRLGNANFEGIVYARGSIHVLNQIHVRGGLVAAGGHVNEVGLGSGSSLTYIKDFFGHDEQAVVFGAGLSLRHWAVR